MYQARKFADDLLDETRIKTKLGKSITVLNFEKMIQDFEETSKANGARVKMKCRQSLTSTDNRIPFQRFPSFWNPRHILLRSACLYLSRWVASQYSFWQYRTHL